MKIKSSCNEHAQMMVKKCTEEKIDMINIKSDKTIVILINALNQEGIDIEEDCGKSEKRKASRNAAENNWQSSTEVGNSNIYIQSNNIVVDNDIQR